MLCITNVEDHLSFEAYVFFFGNINDELSNQEVKFIQYGSMELPLWSKQVLQTKAKS